MREQILKLKKIKKTFVPKIILHNYILYKDDPTYVAIFAVYLRMDLIFTNFPTGKPCAVLEICKSDASLSQLGKLPRRSDQPYIKYNCAILFFGTNVFFIF